MTGSYVCMLKYIAVQGMDRLSSKDLSVHVTLVVSLILDKHVRLEFASNVRQYHTIT